MEKASANMSCGTAGRERVPGRVLALLGLLWVCPAHGQPRFDLKGYDPKSCWVDADGRVFVQIRDQFMAVPVAQFGLAEPEHPDSPRKPTMAGDASEPKGCPGNPVQTTSYLPRLHIAPRTQAPGPAPDLGWSVGRVELIYTVPRPVQGRPGVIWLGEDINLGFLDRVCARATIRERLPDGMEACRIKQVDPKVRVEDWAATYTVPLDVYATPLGNRFVIDCGPGLYSDRISHCTVAYSLNENVGVFYTFHPFGPGSHLALERVIDFDRQMRSVVGGYVSDGRRWLGKQ